MAAIINPYGVGTAVFTAGCGIALLGVAVLLFFGFNQISKGMLYISKKIGLGIKKLFIGGKANEN